MEYKKAINDTINELKGSFRPADDDELVRAVQERAERMNDKNENVRQVRFTEITPEYVEPRKSHKALNVFFGIAGTAAVLAGAVFGLNWLNEHGGLKEREIETSAGAGYSSNAETTTAAAKGFDYIFQSYSSNGSGYVNIDQRYGVGDDLTVHLKGYRFDGVFAKIGYELIFKDEIIGDASDIRQIWPKDTENGHCDNVEYEIEKNTVLCTANYRLETFVDHTEVEFGYKDDPQSLIFGLTMQKSTDSIDAPIITTATYMTALEDVSHEVTTAVYMTTTDNGDASVMTEETTVTTEISDDTTSVIPEDSISSTTTGYYEGEAALDILKQYAGEDYCFPLENWKKEVINYRTGQEYRFNIPAEEGEPILAVTGGTVIETVDAPATENGYWGDGINITIQASDGRKWRYSHLSDIYVSEGDVVKAGDRIAAVGATGWCTGPLVCISFPDSEVIDPVAVEGGIVGIAQNIE